jgi:IPT/TIG domain
VTETNEAGWSNSRASRATQPEPPARDIDLNEIGFSNAGAVRGDVEAPREGEIPTELPPHPPGPVTPGWSNVVAVREEGAEGGGTAPVLTSLNPATAVLGDPNFTLSCIGEGFTADAVIVFNGLDEPTTVVSETEVTTGVDMSVWAAPATLPVTVRTAAGESAPLTFEFTAVR